MNILHLDTNHKLLLSELSKRGFANDEDYTSNKEQIKNKIHLYHGIVIRSRINLDRQLLEKAKNLKFIARVGSGLENIDSKYANSKGISLISAPEGNSNAVGEHALAMLLCMFNKLNKCDKEVKKGKWLREINRGVELQGKTVGIIGYGNTGRAFARKLKGFDLNIICHDIKLGVGDENCKQVSLQELQEKADIISLHIPQTKLSINMINYKFIKSCKKPFWLINTARGKLIVTQDLVDALKSGKVLGAALDVLEYEKKSFENLFKNKIPKAFSHLIKSDKVLLSPHIAGWTLESKQKLAQIIVNKITVKFSPFN
ncbi:MAG: 2-hydroxyacid dehydrogenase [Tenacibaculum sp.]